MRTIEEVREWVETESKGGIGYLTGYEILAFIGSTSPCRHPHAWFYPKSEHVYPDINGYPATFCPDCGERLIDSKEST